MKLLKNRILRISERTGLKDDGQVISLRDQTRATIRSRRLFSSQQSILVAVSGGVDSMVLLDVLFGLAPSQGWRITVAHLNHQLRGSSSLADERLVIETARKLKLPSAVSRADVRGFAREKGVSIEMAARRLRHEFLARTAVEHGIDSVALAHHLDDQVELFFLRLLRGSGSQGLAGMKWSSPSASNRQVTLVRPLLECTKQRLREYAVEAKIPFREDASNSCLDLQRNRIRHQLLPLLKRHYQHSLSDCVSRLMDILGAESEFITTTAEFWLRARKMFGLSKKEGGHQGKGRRQAPVFPGSTAPTSLVDFESLPTAIQRRCLQLQLTRLGAQPDFDLIEHLRNRPEVPIAIGRDRMESCEIGVHSPRGGRTTQGRSMRLASKNGLIAKVTPEKAVSFQTNSTGLDLRKEGTFDFDGVRLEWRVRQKQGLKLPARVAGREEFDADKIGPEVMVRHWRPGDRFQPIGMRKLAKVQDLFVNQKVPRERRRQLLVATTVTGELFWIEGLRISERFKLTKGTIRRLQWRWQRL